MNIFHYIPAPHPQESPSSLLRRTVLNNGFRTARLFSYRLDLSLTASQLLQNSKFHLLLQQAHPEIDFQDAFYKKITFKPGHPIDIGGCDVPAAQLSLLESGICTECLKAGWEHRIKDLRCVDYCPIHLCKYIFTCPKCNSKFRHFSQLSTTCNCGEILSSSPVTRDIAELELELTSIINNKDQEILDNFFFALKKFRYRTQAYSQELKRIIALCSLDLATGNIIGAYHRLNNNVSYPQNLSSSAIIAQLKYASRTPIPPSTIAQLKSMHLINIGRIPGISFTITELCSVLDITHGYWLTGTFSAFKKTTQDRYTADETLEIYNLYLTELAKNLKEFAISVSVVKAQQTLDVPKSLIIKLYRLKHLTKLYRGKLLPSRITQDSLEKLHNKYISIWALSKLLKANITDIQNAAIESGTPYLDQSSTDTPYLIERNSLSVLQEQLTNSAIENKLNLSKALKIRPIDSPQHTKLITISEACKRLTCQRQELCLLISHGILKSYRIKYWRMLKSADVSSFKRKYITLSNIKKTTGLHKDQILEVLKELKVRSVTVNRGNLTITIFKNSEVKNVSFDISCEFASNLIIHKPSNKSVTFDQAREELGLARYELVKLARKIIRRRPLFYQSQYFKRAFTHKELEELRQTATELVPLEAIAREHGISQIQITSKFNITKNKEKIYLNKVAHISKSLALEIRSFYNNYISIDLAAKRINVSTQYLNKLLALHPDPKPYLKSTPRVKCMSSGHLHFLYKLIRGLPDSFSGPIRLI